MEPDTFVEQRLQALRAGLSEDPIAWLGNRLGLTPTEEQILWLTGQTLKASRRVLAVVHGERELDASLAGIARTVDGDDPSALEIDPEIVERARGLVRVTDAMVVMHGGAGTGRRSLLVALHAGRGSSP